MKAKILLVDSEPLLLGVIGTYFDRNGRFELMTTSSSERAVEMLEDNPETELVILDSDCLGNGEVLQIIKKLVPKVQTLLYSGKLIGTEIPQEFGVDAILPKGRHPLELMDSILQLLPMVGA